MSTIFCLQQQTREADLLVYRKTTPIYRVWTCMSCFVGTVIYKFFVPFV